jgi:Schlafen, AlbA_2
MAARILGPSDITSEALKNLIGNAEEGQTIDFKRAINLEKAEAKRDLAVDISAFANESGGDIIFGMDQSSEGIASRLVALPDFNRDQTPLRISQINQSHIEPAVAGLQFVPIEFESGQFALVLRIPRSWNKPHAVVGKPYTWHIRDGKGNRSMKPRELREAFTLSVEISERMKNFRLGRIEQLTKGTPPVFLSSRELLVLHLMPVSAFDSPLTIDLAAIFKDLGLAHPIHADVNLETLIARYNFDGVIAHRQMVQENEKLTYYTQIFRNACIESVNSRILEARSPTTTTGILTVYEHWVEAAVRRFMQLLQKNSVEPPIFVLLSMIGVRGRQIGWILNEALGSSAPPSQIDRDPLLLPEIRIDAFAPDYYEALRPAFDVVWQSSGRSGSVNYTDGKWAPSDSELQEQNRRGYRPKYS